MVIAPVAKDKPSVLLEAAADLGRRGFTRLRVEGKVVTLEEAEGVLKGREVLTLEVVVDRIVAGPDQRSRLADSLSWPSGKVGTARSSWPKPRAVFGRSTHSPSISPANIAVRPTRPSIHGHFHIITRAAPAPIAVASADN